MDQTFGAVSVLLGGGGGGGGGRGGGRQMLAVGVEGEQQMRAVGIQDRNILEQTIGAVFLDRLNGYPVGSMAYIYKSLGGTHPTVIAVLQDAFGDNFDEVAAKGREHTISQVKSALKKALADENLVAPTTMGFRDMLFHLNPKDTFSAYKQIEDLSSTEKA